MFFPYYWPFVSDQWSVFSHHNGTVMHSFKDCSVVSAEQTVKLRVICPVMTLMWRHSLHWRYNDHDIFSNHQPRRCLLNHLFRRRSKKTSKLRVTGICAGNSLGPVNSPHKGPVTRKMFSFDYVIMCVLTRFPSEGADTNWRGGRLTIKMSSY